MTAGVPASEHRPDRRRRSAIGDAVRVLVRLRAGQRVTLNGTLFDDFVCTVLSIEPRDRVCVLLEFMQHAAKMMIPSENVRWFDFRRPLVADGRIFNY